MIQNNSHGSYQIPTKSTKATAKVSNRNVVVGQPVVSKMNGEHHVRTGNTPLKGKRHVGTKMVKTSAGIAM